MQSNKGRVFFNRDFKEQTVYMHIEYFASNNDKKASVERFNRTLKTRLQKIMTPKGSSKLIDSLQMHKNAYKKFFFVVLALNLQR